MSYLDEYKRWCMCALDDTDVVNELKQMAGDEEKIEEAFYRDLTFGTGGLRGIIGAGTNRMNVYTVAKASQGLANYLASHSQSPSVIIGYDSRLKSDVFAKIAASVFAANGVKVYIWQDLTPVPMVSYAIRYLRASAGVMITASHNPGKYNGYKVYGLDGCQITTETARVILGEIEQIDLFADVKRGSFDTYLSEHLISYISHNVFDAYVKEVKQQSVLYGEDVDKNVSIVYSPLNGTGRIPVIRTLNELGYSNILVVKEQEMPDGNFPTCPYPNPEIKEAMTLGVEYAKKYRADLLLATDPDCDRVGIAVKDENGAYVLLSGNETGALLLDYICSQRVKHGKMPDAPVMIKTIVTTEMGERIASDYGVKTINVLTGFKYIGEQIGLLENEGRPDSFIFGFEESFGYLSGGYVRDKDGVNAACLICEMYSYYATQGISLLDKLRELSERYGYWLNSLYSYEFEGVNGSDEMDGIMKRFREGVESFGGQKVRTVLDYSKGIDGLPKSDVLKYLLDGNSSVVVRPSGTESKLKVYISASAASKEEVVELEKKIAIDTARFLKN